MSESLQPFPDDWTRGLVLMAHPDDPEYGTSLAVDAWTRAGKDIRYVLATAGEAGIEGMAPEEAGPLREQEQRRAIGHVGVTELEFLGLPDGRLEYGLPLRRELARAIRRHQPEVVITLQFGLTFGGVHRNPADHRGMGLAVLDAVSDAANSWIFRDLEEPRWAGVRHIAVFADPDPTHLVKVAGSRDACVAALAEHREYMRALSDEPVEEQAARQVDASLQGDADDPHVAFRVYGG